MDHTLPSKQPLFWVLPCEDRTTERKRHKRQFRPSVVWSKHTYHSMLAVTGPQKPWMGAPWQDDTVAFPPMRSRPHR